MSLTVRPASADAAEESAPVLAGTGGAWGLASSERSTPWVAAVAPEDDEAPAEEDGAPALAPAAVTPPSSPPAEAHPASRVAAASRAAGRDAGRRGLTAPSGAARPPPPRGDAPPRDPPRGGAGRARPGLYGFFLPPP